MGIEPTTIYGQYMGFFARHLIVPQYISQPPYNKRRYDLEQKLGRSKSISPKIRNCYDLITQTNGSIHVSGQSTADSNNRPRFEEGSRFFQ